MINKNLKSYFLLLITTIVLIRFLGYLFPIIILNNYNFYHFYIGILLLFYSYIRYYINCGRKSEYFIEINLIGVAFVIDQFVFLIVKEKTNQGYWSVPSISGLIILLILYLIYFLIVKVIFLRLKYRIVKDEYEYLKSNSITFLFISSMCLGIIIPRIIVFLSPGTSTILLGYEIHHIFPGLLILLIYSPIFITLESFYNVKTVKLSIVSIGFAYGLIIDEFYFLLSGGTNDADYWKISVVLSVIVLLFILSFLTYIFLRKNQKYPK